MTECCLDHVVTYGLQPDNALMLRFGSLKIAPHIHVTACKRAFPSTAHKFELICSEVLLAEYVSGKTLLRVALFGFLIKLPLKNKGGTIVCL